ncbi:unnamed protein product [Strongylus vulgaris]|uniref:DUF4440 domain-containing protein n=1 Tax=Strongylus vulgaris TaxID=40348 RepID=A0A3P7LF70_STRVU|nr:unnamed protein product [Strongylus vulgaris]
MVYTEAKIILQPIFDQYWKDFDEGHFDKLLEHYHPDAVLIEVGKKGTYGKEATNNCVLLVLQLSNEHYQMSEDFIMYCADYEINTERAGKLQGKFSQIWRKTNDKYLLLREAYLEDA